jgi:hypothetical protein
MQYNSNLPLVTIDRVSLYSDNQKTKVELLLVLKSTEQQLVAENLKIKILQCTNQNMFLCGLSRCDTFFFGYIHKNPCQE